MPVLLLYPFSIYYAQNYAGIIGQDLTKVHVVAWQSEEFVNQQTLYLSIVDAHYVIVTSCM